MDILSSLRVESPVSYLIAFLVPAFDAILPVLPAETLIIALGVATAGRTDPRIAVLVGCAALGAFVGDNLTYLIGRRFGPFAERRFFSSKKGADRRAWAERSLERFGVLIIIACRFIPAGRTAITLTCGILRYSRRRFMVATGIGAVIWALQAFFAGRLGGRAFQDKPWAGFLVGLAAAAVITGLVEVIRRIAGWRARRKQR
ncbi:MAG TPA: DedA family protein [Trebonia sp.]|nr:DedA family protein [Trebonia sp.]